MPITAAMLAYWGGRQRVSRAFWRAWLIPGVVSTMLSFVVVRSLLAALDPVPGYEREVAAFFYSVMLAFLVWLAGFICIVRCRRNSDGTWERYAYGAVGALVTTIFGLPLLLWLFVISHS